MLDKIPEAFHHLIEAAKFAVLKAKELGMVAINLAKEAQAAWIAAEKQLLAIAREAIVAVANGVEKVAFDGAMIILDAVQKDTTLVDIAQAALDVAEKAEELAFAAAKWLTDKIATSLNIESIELVGTLRGSGGNQPGFTIMVKGVVLGHRIDFVGHWSPADTLTFLINLCAELWEMLKRNMLPSFTAGDVGETKRIEG